MKCITSPALDDTQIISYMEGEAADAIKAHIEKCPYCAERASQMALFQNHLRARYYRSTCPSSMELGDYHLGLLPPPRVLVIAQHIRECPHCRREVAELDEFLTELDVKPSLLETAKVLIARLAGTGAESGATPAFGALRGESKGPLTFEADGVVIILDIQPGSNGQVSILGQLAADDQDRWTGAQVELQQIDSPQQIESVDDLGAFRFEAVRSGSTQLAITSLDGIIVRVPNFHIAV